MRVMKIVVVCLFLVFAALTIRAAEHPVDVRVSRAIATAPADVMVTATVVPDERNRGLVITAESVDYLRRSTIELAGEDEARVHQLWLNSLPEGDYVVSALVLDREGPRAIAEVKMRVFGGRRGDPREP
jgi:hypothetical protein